MPQGQLDLLLRTVSGHKTVLILLHNDPDPDAIASAVALRYLLAEKIGVEGRIAYGGIIGRAENKEMVRYLGHPLNHLTAADLQRSLPIALVDTQPGAGNNSLPSNSTPAIVLDHHPWREATARAAFSDVRPELGATSTILNEYLQNAAIEPLSHLATALFYGIKTDTMGLARGASADDVAAYFYLQSRIDVDALLEIERAQVPAEYFKSLDAALHAARVYDGVVISYVGRIGHPDLAAEMADLLLRLQGTRSVICKGAYGARLILAVRSRSQLGEAGQLAQEIVGNRGTAGGHGTMAGGQIPLQGEAPEQMVQRLIWHTLEYLQVGPHTPGQPLI